jgi:antibiotic biosynthesis monooxygenase (ABM) superfamily enzyme
MRKQKTLPAPFAALTKDARFAGTFEVLVPAPDRVKPHRVPLQFESQENAESWIHSPDGKETIDTLLGRERK